jgi:hypothetical protein
MQRSSLRIFRAVSGFANLFALRKFMHSAPRGLAVRDDIARTL